MAEIRKSEFEISVEHQEELQQIAQSREAEQRKQEHELKIAKLKFATQPRYKSIERGVVAFAKTPALIVALICMTFLAYNGREVPEQISKFVTT